VKPCATASEPLDACDRLIDLVALVVVHRTVARVGKLGQQQPCRGDCRFGLGMEVGELVMADRLASHMEDQAFRNHDVLFGCGDHARYLLSSIEAHRRCGTTEIVKASPIQVAGSTFFRSYTSYGEKKRSPRPLQMAERERFAVLWRRRLRFSRPQQEVEDDMNKAKERDTAVELVDDSKELAAKLAGLGAGERLSMLLRERAEPKTGVEAASELLKRACPSGE
jgi:hypothetical protein